MIRTEVVERIQYDIEAFEPRYVELGLFDVPMDGIDVNVRIERCRGLCCYL